jgi:hypothetical protein
MSEGTSDSTKKPLPPIVEGTANITNGSAKFLETPVFTPEGAQHQEKLLEEYLKQQKTPIFTPEGAQHQEKLVEEYLKQQKTPDGVSGATYDKIREATKNLGVPLHPTGDTQTAPLSGKGALKSGPAGPSH